MVEAQQWLADNYKNKDNAIEIRIDDGIELDGKLMIDNYPKLKNIFLDDTKGITELKFNNCPNVEVVFVSYNKIEQNKTKLNEKLPSLLDKTAKVDDTKLEEIKNNVEKGKEYQKLVAEPTNAPIVDADKIDQTKLTDELEKAANYEKLVENENN